MEEVIQEPKPPPWVLEFYVYFWAGIYFSFSTYKGEVACSRHQPSNNMPSLVSVIIG
jgi:hypothetical protein